MDSKALNEIDAYFSKTFVVSQSGEKIRLQWKLPASKNIYSSSIWTNDELLELKHEMNAIKDQLSDKDITDWGRHTASLNVTKSVVPHLRSTIKPELCTQAWCKFYEILCNYPLVPYSKNLKAFNSVHVCEAPGAFISSLNHYLSLNFPHIKLCWLASSLNPYYEGNRLQETIQDDRFIRSTVHRWCFGVDNTGDLLMKENRQQLYTKADALGEIHLVTADGSVDCQNNPGEQESIVAHLHLAEALAALRMLSRSGNFVMKMFSFYEHTSVCLLYLLACTFDQLHVFKPGTSSAGNSEVYVVALGYVGLPSCVEILDLIEENSDQESLKFSLFSYGDIPLTFIDKVVKCATCFKKWQSETILENLQLFLKKNPKHFKARSQLKTLAASNFIFRYGIGMIPEEACIVVVKKLKENPTRNKPLSTGSYLDRLKIKELSFKDRLKYLEAQCTRLLQSNSLVQNCLKLVLPEFVEDISTNVTVGKEFLQCLNSAFCDVALLILYNQLIDCCWKMCQEVKLPELLVIRDTYFPENVISSLTDLNDHLRFVAHSTSYQQMVDDMTQYSISSLKWKPVIERERKMMVATLNEDSKLITTYGTNFSHQMISNFCTILKALGEGDHLLLLLNPLLIRVEVGLIYILVDAFQEVNLIISSDGMSKGMAHCSRFKGPTNKLHETLNMLQTIDRCQCVLEVINITNLLEEPFCSCIYDFNCDFVTKQTNQLLAFLKSSKVSPKET